MRFRHEVYYNLHKQCLSVRAVGGGSFVFHRDSMLLEDVRFAVQPAGNAKVRATGRKNVHAFVRGYIFDISTLPAMDAYRQDQISKIMLDPTMQKITYNPYKYDSFVDQNTLTPVYTADKVYIVGRDIYAVGAK